MSDSILDKIQEIEEEAKRKIDALRSGAISEIAKKISEKKSELAALEIEYTRLTGKTLTGEKAPVTRKRLTAQEKAALVETVSSILAKSPNGIAMRDIVAQAGESVSAVRDALKQVKGIRTTGAKASTLYFAK
jgi:hypothetical protein